jgi:hypothetical protein
MLRRVSPLSRERIHWPEVLISTALSSTCRRRRQVLAHSIPDKVLEHISVPIYRWMSKIRTSQTICIRHFLHDLEILRIRQRIRTMRREQMLRRTIQSKTMQMHLHCTHQYNFNLPPQSKSVEKRKTDLHKHQHHPHPQLHNSPKTSSLSPSTPQ